MALHFPWNIAGDVGLSDAQTVGSVFNGEPMNTSPSFLSLKAHFYGDAHKNDRFRVRAVVEGLTDIPSYMYDETAYIVDYDEFGERIVAYKYLHAMDGLQIGDEFVFHGTNKGLTQLAVNANLDFIRAGRWYGTWGVPLANVKAGVVVTTFGAKHFFGEAEVDNPYKDYATTIVLRPGDYLNGTRVGGKIFVNFSEQPNRFEGGVRVQVLPGSTDDDATLDPTWPANYKHDTAAQREWEYSGTRYALSSLGTGTTSQNITVALPDGTSFTTSIKSGNDFVSYRTQASELFPLRNYPMFTMVQRGAMWIGVRPDIGDGDVFPSTASMAATAAMPQPTVVAQRDGGYTAQPMRALAAMPKVAEDETGDAQVVTLAMEAYASFTSYSKVISASPMTATAELVENFDMVHTSGEQVVLTLHGVDAVLYLKEEE
jgi:hypothetical protein